MNLNSRELNRDVKRLWKSYQTLNDRLNEHIINMNQFNDEVESKIKKEYYRLSYADDSFRYFNRKSILILIILNRKFGFMRQFRFGLNIDESEL